MRAGQRRAPRDGQKVGCTEQIMEGRKKLSALCGQEGAACSNTVIW